LSIERPINGAWLVQRPRCEVVAAVAPLARGRAGLPRRESPKRTRRSVLAVKLDLPGGVLPARHTHGTLLGHPVEQPDQDLAAAIGDLGRQPPPLHAGRQERRDLGCGDLLQVLRLDERLATPAIGARLGLALQACGGERAAVRENLTGESVSWVPLRTVLCTERPFDQNKKGLALPNRLAEHSVV